KAPSPGAGKGLLDDSNPWQGQGTPPTPPPRVTGGANGEVSWLRASRPRLPGLLTQWQMRGTILLPVTVAGPRRHFTGLPSSPVRDVGGPCGPLGKARSLTPRVQETAPGEAAERQPQQDEH